MATSTHLVERAPRAPMAARRWRSRRCSPPVARTAARRRSEALCPRRQRPRSRSLGRSAAVVERRRREEGDRSLRRARNDARRCRLRAAVRAHRDVRQRRHALVRAADVRAARVRARPRARARAAAPGVADRRAVQVRARGRPEGRARGRRARARGADRGHARRQHDGRVRRNRPRSGSRPRSIRASAGRTSRCVYQPMLELLAYLRANGFKTFIVSGGGVEFMRPWTEDVYGIPPEQVVGSRAKLEVRGPRRHAAHRAACGHRPRRRQGRQAGRDSAADRPPADRGIRQLRRRLRDARMDDVRPGRAARDDRPPHRSPTREWAYDRDSQVGKLARGLDEAPRRGWVVVDMKQDWKVVYPFEQ